MFQLETFGFLPEGVMQLTFEHFDIHTNEPVRAGFLMHLTESETTAKQDIEEALENLEKDPNNCWLDHAGKPDEIIDMSNKDKWQIQVKGKWNISVRRYKL